MADDTKSVPAPPESKRKRALGIVGVIVAVAAVGLGGYAFLMRNEESTDDAQVDADVVNVSSRVAGPVAHILASDNEAVKKGQVLVELDATDLDVKKKQAEADLEAAKAQAAVADAQAQIAGATSKGGLYGARAALEGSAAASRTADAQIEVARAAAQRAATEAERATADFERNEALFAKGGVPRVQVDNARSARDAAVAAKAQAEAQLEASLEGKKSAESRVGEAQARVAQSSPVDAQLAAAAAQADLAHARVKAAEAALETATLQAGYAKIVSPVDGTLSKIAVRVGQNVGPGQLVVAVVPATTYVVANFKETQVGRMKPGQKADIVLDAFKGKKLEGTVASVSPATGSRFALLPPDNASGNFVKVVQRVPVLIHWSGTPAVPLAAGLSAEVTVHVE